MELLAGQQRGPLEPIPLAAAVVQRVRPHRALAALGLPITVVLVAQQVTVALLAPQQAAVAAVPVARWVLAQPVAMEILTSSPPLVAAVAEMAAVVRDLPPMAVTIFQALAERQQPEVRVLLAAAALAAVDRGLRPVVQPPLE